MAQLRGKAGAIRCAARGGLCACAGGGGQLHACERAGGCTCPPPPGAGSDRRGGGTTPTPVRVKLLQASDGTAGGYDAMLNATAPVNAAFAARHGYAYEAFRGIHPFLERAAKKRSPDRAAQLATANKVALLDDG